MTEIEKTRESKTPRTWEKWILFTTAMGIMFGAMTVASMPGHQGGAVAMVFLSAILWVKLYSLPSAALHKELVQEIDALRRELEQYRKAM